MNIEELRDYCLSFAGASESMPFDDTTLVFKVMDKMFALTSLDGELSISVKCNPELAIELRERYSCVVPGYHMNKVHWNTVFIDGTVAEVLVKEWITRSYTLIVAALPKKLKDELAQIQKECS